jgi:hypothetical protein
MLEQHVRVWLSDLRHLYDRQPQFIKGALFWVTMALGLLAYYLFKALGDVL